LFTAAARSARRGVRRRYNMVEVEKLAKEARAKAECSRSQLRETAKAPWVNEREER
jgi:electron transfer flavoprotein alpha subunit